MATKQVIVIRADLKLRRGKECAQVAHAASMWMRDYALECSKSAELGLPPATLTTEQQDWLASNYRKIVVKCMSEKELRHIADIAESRGLNTYIVTDDGLTEVPPGTVTALAIGPYAEQFFVGLTDHLPLY